MSGRKHVTYKVPGTKISLLGPKRVPRPLCLDKIFLKGTYNIAVLAYINKEEGVRWRPLCVLLWRILTWSSRNRYLARHTANSHHKLYYTSFKTWLYHTELTYFGQLSTITVFKSPMESSPILTRYDPRFLTCILFI